MKSLRSLATCLLVAPLLLVAVQVRAADEFPAREIHAICMFPPGTGADILVRFFAGKLQQIIGSSVVVENKVGAQGTIATEAVARAKPDGYTIAITPGSSTLAMAPYLFKDLHYDPVKDFEPVAPLATLSFDISVDGNSPIKTLDDLTKFLKSDKAKGFFGGGSNTGVVSAALYLKAIGVKSQEVNFRTPTDTLAALKAGDIDFTAVDNTWAVGNKKEGRIRTLVVTGNQRASAMPDVPTFKELGYDFAIEPWWAVYVPAGTPKPVIEKLRAAFAKVMESPDTIEFLKRAALDKMEGDPESLRKLLLSDIKKWNEYLELAKIPRN
jgi:tripartite-type tricarboxylate transporter receptor subunit TctC